MFQSTRPHGARRAGSRVGHHTPDVSIHAPARGATWTKNHRWTSTPFQSTRPHGARLTLSWRNPSAGPVSIHAPARGATCRSLLPGRDGAVSIHAPARGATRTPATCTTTTACFNPRARTGRDSVILPTRISTPIVGPIAIPSHDLLISPITPIQVRKFLMITRCWRRANRQRKTRSLQVRGSKNQGTL